MRPLNADCRYLGLFEDEIQAAKAYDNFNVSNFEQELKHFEKVLMRSQLQQSGMHSYVLEQQSWLDSNRLSKATATSSIDCMHPVAPIMTATLLQFGTC